MPELVHGVYDEVAAPILAPAYDLPPLLVFDCSEQIGDKG